MRRFLLLLAVWPLMLPGGDVLAQHSQQHPGRSDANLPAWAEPSPAQQRGQQPAGRVPFGTQQTPAQPQMTPAPPPSTPQAPLGGLEWLALAGGTYALHRLGRCDGEEDDAGDGGTLP